MDRVDPPVKRCRGGGPAGALSVSLCVVLLLAVLGAGGCDFPDRGDTLPDPTALVACLEGDGFVVQEGELRRVDVLSLCSQGYLKYCFGNNDGFPYLS